MHAIACDEVLYGTRVHCVVIYCTSVHSFVFACCIWNHNIHHTDSDTHVNAEQFYFRERSRRGSTPDTQITAVRSPSREGELACLLRYIAFYATSLPSRHIPSAQRSRPTEPREPRERTLHEALATTLPAREGLPARARQSLSAMRRMEPRPYSLYCTVQSVGASPGPK